MDETHGARAGADAIAPGEHTGHWCWEGRRNRARFRFYGRPLEPEFPAEDAILEELRSHGLEIARLRQCHSRRVVAARAGECGRADALITGRRGLALLVVTADCVPVVLASRRRIGAVHAGWRGIRSGIVEATLEAWGDPPPEAAILGPAIGPCCYEVADDVARDLARATGRPDIVTPRDPRPHVDLRRAVEHQLRSRGVESVLRIDCCTRCEAERLWSFRREGARAGRNLCLVWIARR